MRAINIDVFVCLLVFSLEALTWFMGKVDYWQYWRRGDKYKHTKNSFEKISRRWENRRVKKISPGLSAWVIGREVSPGITHGTQVRKRTRENVSLLGHGGHLVSIIIILEDTVTALKSLQLASQMRHLVPQTDHFSISTGIKRWEGGRQFKCRKDWLTYLRTIKFSIITSKQLLRTF